MKRILSLLILLFMAVSLILPISSINSNQTKIVEPVLLSEITYDLAITEIVEELDPYEKAIQEMQEEMKEIESIEDNKEWFIAYKNIVFKYTEWIDPPETVFDYFTEDEVRLLCQMAETECYQQDFDSKCNVIAVAMNRFYSGDFGDTMTEVITNESQFAYGRKCLTEDSILAVQYVFDTDYTAQGALYFHSNKKTETFNKRTYIFTDDSGHHFY